MVWPLILAGARAYAPYVVFPFAVAVGAAGYLFETRFRNAEKWQKSTESTLDERRDRQLDKILDVTEVGKLQYKDLQPKTMFDKNQGYRRGFTGRSLEAQVNEADNTS